MQRSKGGGGAVGGEVDLVVQPLAQGAVADPVVILDEEDEAVAGPSPVGSLPRVTAEDRVTRRRRASPRLIVRATLVPYSPRKSLEGPFEVAHKVPAQLVVEIIRPEPIQSPSPLRFGPDHRREVARVLGEEEDRPVSDRLPDRALRARRENGAGSRRRDNASHPDADRPCDTREPAKCVLEEERANRGRFVRHRD